MAVPVLLGIGMLLKSLFAAFILWIQKFSGVALRLLGVVLLLVAVALILNEFLAILNGYVADIVATSPANVQNGYSLIQHLVPSNMGLCISLIISMHQAGMVFQWLFYGVNTKAKVLTE